MNIALTQTPADHNSNVPCMVLLCPCVSEPADRWHRYEAPSFSAAIGCFRMIQNHFRGQVQNTRIILPSGLTIVNATTQLSLLPRTTLEVRCNSSRTQRWQIRAAIATSTRRQWTINSAQNQTTLWASGSGASADTLISALDTTDGCTVEPGAALIAAGGQWLNVSKQVDESIPASFSMHGIQVRGFRHAFDVDSNMADKASGGVSISGVDAVEITECDFHNCTAPTRSGGALFIDGADAVFVRNSSFINCTSGRGGGLAVLSRKASEAALAVSGSMFIKCSAENGGSGGGLWASIRGHVAVHESLFLETHSACRGGGVAVEGCETGNCSTSVTSTLGEVTSVSALSQGIECGGYVCSLKD